MTDLQQQLKKVLLPEISGFVIMDDFMREYEGNPEAGRAAITIFSRSGKLPKRLVEEIIEWIMKHDKTKESNPREGFFCSSIPLEDVGSVSISLTVSAHEGGSFLPLDIEVEITHPV